MHAGYHDPEDPRSQLQPAPHLISQSRMSQTETARYGGDSKYRHHSRRDTRRAQQLSGDVLKPGLGREKDSIQEPLFAPWVEGVSVVTDERPEHRYATW